MGNLFVDLEQDDTANWQNWVDPGNQVAVQNTYHQPYQSGGQSNTGSTGDSKSGVGNAGLTVDSPNQSYSTPQSISCYECDYQGNLVGSSYVGITQCPPGTTSNPNHSCVTGTDSQLNDQQGNLVSCSKCDGGSPISNMFPNGCPPGWLPDSQENPIDPCTDIDCWDCETGSKQRVPNAVPCASATAIRVPVVNNSSSNPCVSVGPEKDCWNCTTGQVTRIADGEECIHNEGEAVYLMNIKANGSSDNPCKAFSNSCYKCTEGVVESQIYQSDIEAECPDGWTQDRKPCLTQAAEEEEIIEEIEEKVETETPEPKTAGFLGKNTKFLTFAIIGLGVLMLLKKKPATK